LAVHGVECGTPFCRSSASTPQTAPPLSPSDTDWQTNVHARGYCAMRGFCGRRSDGDPLNCAMNVEASEPSPELALALQATCPLLWASQGGISGRFCCDKEQVDSIASSVSSWRWCSKKRKHWFHLLVGQELSLGALLSALIALLHPSLLSPLDAEGGPFCCWMPGLSSQLCAFLVRVSYQLSCRYHYYLDPKLENLLSLHQTRHVNQHMSFFIYAQVCYQLLPKSGHIC